MIGTVAFPPVFTDTVNTNAGTFDTAYPPLNRNDGTNCPNFAGNYKGYMGDYDAAVTDCNHVYYTWGDNRDTTTWTNGVTRNEANVRLLKLSWP